MSYFLHKRKDELVNFYLCIWLDPITCGRPCYISLHSSHESQAISGA